MPIAHGGDVLAAATQFGIPRDQWLDLSTGISPWSCPVPDIPESVFRCLPRSDRELETAAANYFGCSPDTVLAVAGSQAAITAIPRAKLVPDGSIVAVPAAGYREHCESWRKAGAEIVFYQSLPELKRIISKQAVTVVIAINPNNPTGHYWERDTLLDLAAELASRRGLLIVDEAFIDATPRQSLANSCPRDGLIVLRSLGKFFGLAGARLGFVLASEESRQLLIDFFPHWPVSNVARWLGSQSLGNTDWQEQQRNRLSTSCSRWHDLLSHQFADFQWRSAALFVTGFAEQEYCQYMFAELAKQGILVRLFDSSEGVSAIRFGLPSEEVLAEFINRINAGVGSQSSSPDQSVIARC